MLTRKTTLDLILILILIENRSSLYSVVDAAKLLYHVHRTNFQLSLTGRLPIRQLN